MKLPRFFSRRAAPAIVAPVAARAEAEGPKRETIAFPTLSGIGQAGDRRVAWKPTPRNLRYFSTTPYARRAINAIKQPVASLDWRIVAKPGVPMSREIKRQIRVATACFERPNSDDSFRTSIEQVVEDVLCGAGAIELVACADPERPLWMYPVDGLTIQLYPGWSGDPEEARYVQSLGFGSVMGSAGVVAKLQNRELSYLRANTRTCTPFGLGPLEVAFNSVSRQLGVAEFAGNVASNQRPSVGLDMGSGTTPEIISAFRSYWRNEVEGQGQMPVFGLGETAADGKTRGPNVLRFYPEGDTGLFLAYQAFLIREIATAFDLSPQNLGIERDVNRNTSEVAEDRDRQHAIQPMADLIASHLTRDALQGRLGFSHLQFEFVGLNPEDEVSLQKVFEGHYRTNVVTPNEIRARLGMAPSTSPWADLFYVDSMIAQQAARGGDVIDPSLDPYPGREGGKVDPAPKASKS